MANPKGNPKMVKGGPPINPHGAGGPNRRAKMNLAVWLREKWPADLIQQWLDAVLMGAVPELVVDPVTGDRHVVARVDGIVPPTMEQRFRAISIILDRSLGAVPQSVHLNAEVSAQIGVAVAAFSPDKLRTLPPDKLRALRDSLMGVLSVPGVVPAPPSDGSEASEGAIDAESSDV